MGGEFDVNLVLANYVILVNHFSIRVVRAFE